MTLARAKAGSTQTQSLLVPPYHLDVEFRRLVARDQRTSFTFRETFKSVGSGKDLLAAITSVSALSSPA